MPTIDSDGGFCPILMWTLEASGNGYKLKCAGGYQNLGMNAAWITETGGNTFTLTNDNGVWAIGDGSYNIDALGGLTTYYCAGGWPNSGTRFDLYKVNTSTPTFTEITFTGVSEGTTTAIVGTTKYNITVSIPEKTLTTGGSSTIIPVAAVTQADIDAFNAANGAYVTAELLANGTYTVKLIKIMGDGNTVTIDGVRIANTYDNSTIYTIDLEDNPEFYQLRDAVMSAIGIMSDTSKDYIDPSQLEHMTDEDEKTATMTASTDMFYYVVDAPVTNTTEYTVSITNTGDQVLAITDLKVCDDPTAALVPLTEDNVRQILVDTGYTDSTPETPEEPAVPFADVEKDSFYYDAVAWAVSEGITTGISDSHFGPLVFCNRAQIVTFLYRAYN